jgi:GAF domain-containing protein
VAELLAARPAALPEKSRAVTESMACLGGRAEVAVLQVAAGVPEDLVEQRLAPALDEGLLVMEPGERPAVRFRHDRAREAILRGLGPEHRQALHLVMARRLAAVPEMFAAAAEQYLPVAGTVDDAAERRQVVGLLRRAAERVALIGDYALVNTLLAAALPLIDPGEAVTLIPVRTARHAALFCLGRLEEADEEYQRIEELCPTALRRAGATAVQVLSLTHRIRFADAIGLGIGSLRELGIVVPPADRLPADLDRQFGYLYRWLDDTDEAGDLARPDVTDPVLIAVAGLINALLPVNYVTDHGMLGWLSLEGLRIWLEHGPGPALVGPVGHTAFVAVTVRGDYTAGNRAMRRILAFGEARGYEPGTSQARFLHAVLACWSEPLEDGAEAGRRARDGLIAGGDLAYAGYTYLPTVYYQLDSAPSLDVCVAEAEAGLAFARRTGNEEASGWLDCCRWLTGVLRGEGSAEADRAPLSRYESNPLALFHGHVTAAISAAIFGDQAGLVEHTEAAMPLLPVAVGLYTTAVVRLLRGLALADQARVADGSGERGRLLAELDEVTRWLTARAADAPDNFLHLLRLVEAERAWAIGDFRAAGLAYDAARREASLRQRLWHQALIAERAARLYLTRGLDYAGYDLLAQARRRYQAWGATAKTSQLDWAYPALQTRAEMTDGDGALPQDRAVVTTGTIDLLGIVSASQALSSETSIGRLRTRVVEVLSAMTGATGVHLLLWDEDRHGWLLPAPDGDGGTVPVSGTVREEAVPTSVLRYVQRTRETLVVADAARDDRFARDPYFAGADGCSLMAVPILSRGTLRAALLLENRLLGGAFTASRLDAVQLIAGQLAVSLDNAQLYAEFGQIADEQTALRRVAMLVAQAASPENVFAAVTAGAGDLLGVDVAVLVRYDPPDAIMVVGAWTSTGAALPTPVGSRLPLGGDNVTTLVFRTGQAERTDYAEVSGLIGDVATQDWGLRSSVGVPIRVAGRLWGAIVVALTREELLPADAEVRLAGFTELVATAIASAQARAELQGFGEEQAALRRVATLVARAAPPDEVFTAVTAEVRRVLGDFDTNMWRYDPDNTATLLAVLRSADADPSFGVGTRVSLGGHNVTTLVFQTQRPVRIDDYADASGSVADAVRGWEQRLGRRTRSAVGVPVSVAGRLWGAMIVTSAHAPLPADAEVRLAGFTELVATAIASAQARAELQGFGEEQAALRRVATLVARAAPPEEVLAAVTAEAGRLLGAAATVLARYDPDGTQTVVGVWSAAETLPVTVGTRTGLGGRNVSTLVFQTGRPARIDDYADVSGPVATYAREASVRASVGLPISVEGRLWGVVIVASAGEPLPAGIEARLAGFTELVATAIANAEARAALAASRARIVATADATRRRIERDLHDGAQQRLVSLTLRLRAAQAALPRELGTQLDHAVAEAAGALDDLGEIARGIHPAILAERGLTPALKTLARRSPISVDLQVRVKERLPEPVEVSAYYVIAEALTNAAKHARAATVSVQVEVAADVLILEVRDDGAGGADFTHGTGLAGLKDRVEALGGRIFLDSPPGAGTSLRVELPLAATTAASLPRPVRGKSHGMCDSGSPNPMPGSGTGEGTPRRSGRRDADERHEPAEGGSGRRWARTGGRRAARPVPRQDVASPTDQLVVAGPARLLRLAGSVGNPVAAHRPRGRDRAPSLGLRAERLGRVAELGPARLAGTAQAGRACSGGWAGDAPRARFRHVARSPQPGCRGALPVAARDRGRGGRRAHPGGDPGGRGNAAALVSRHGAAGGRGQQRRVARRPRGPGRGGQPTGRIRRPADADAAVSCLRRPLRA